MKERHQIQLTYKETLNITSRMFSFKVGRNKYRTQYIIGEFEDSTEKLIQNAARGHQEMERMK